MKRYYNHTCACGCGNKIEIQEYHKWQGIPRFISGHNTGTKGPILREIRTCAASDCNNKFECRVDSEQKCCCKGCGHKKLKEIRTCIGEDCTNTFEVSPGSKQRFCCKKCIRRKKSETRVCAYSECNNVFRVKVTNKKKFCSRKCQDYSLWQDPVFASKQKAGIRNKWENPVYREKQLKAMRKGLKVSPNKVERLLYSILQNLFPNEYKYVGNWQVTFGGKCPDFINVNGQKKIIELYGDYRHKPEEEQPRIDLFAKFGHKTLIIWEHELKDLDKLKEKLRIFNLETI